METTANEEAIRAWNTVLYEKFVRFRHLISAGVAAHGEEAMHRHRPPRGGRVLDVGCGFGDTTHALARLVGARGEAVGIDAAASFVEGAEREAGRDGAPNARFFTADVQTAPIDGPYDLAFSRFGTMFFASPVAALRNLRRALTPGGKLVMVVWRRREDNPWLHEAEQRVRALVPENRAGDEPTCGPGPFSMANADVVGAQLLAAGFDRIAFERFDTDICIGRDLDEAVDFAMSLGPAGELLRLAGDGADPLRPVVLGALRDALSAFDGPMGVHARSSVWIVSAVARAS